MCGCHKPAQLFIWEELTELQRCTEQSLGQPVLADLLQGTPVVHPRDAQGREQEGYQLGAGRSRGPDWQQVKEPRSRREDVCVRR